MKADTFNGISQKKGIAFDRLDRLREVVQEDRNDREQRARYIISTMFVVSHGQNVWRRLNCNARHPAKLDDCGVSG